MIELGDFRYLFKVYTTSNVKDDVGQVSRQKVLLTTFYGSKMNWQNRLQYEGKQLIESDIIIVKTFYNPEISINDSLEDEAGNSYEIRGIRELGYHEFMEITAQYKSNRS
ncbi:hypothetical protein [Algoriphagus aquimarinus]|uniref:hypothetical protein n=1 Tax=Algoriphagus aquimarinus TaxID=237018 RepID=UPI0030D87B61|tara:strand:- start:41415 stop:41744 length:330 start_codon:yes stop_codon:yes gene_type:complete